MRVNATPNDMRLHALCTKIAMCGWVVTVDVDGQQATCHAWPLERSVRTAGIKITAPTAFEAVEAVYRQVAGERALKRGLVRRIADAFRGGGKRG